MIPGPPPSRPCRHRAASPRRGAVLVETALVLMLLLGLCFGVMEYGHYVHTRHTLEGAANRGGRMAILRDITEDEVIAAIDGVMAAAGYTNAEYSITITGLDDQDETDVSVSVGCTWGEVGIRPLGLISADSQVQATVTMRKEGP